VESGGLEVVSMAKVLAAIKLVSDGAFETSMAPEVARKAGVQLMLAGQVDQLDEGFLLTAELVDVAHGTALGSFTKQAGSKSELFALAGAIADEVRVRLRQLVHDAGSRSFDLADALTDSPEAYRQFTAGVQAFHGFHLEEAADHFEEAIREDPSFAMAHYRLTATQEWLGFARKASETIREGLPHISRLPEHWQAMYLGYHAYLMGNHEEAHDSLTELVESSVAFPDVYYFLGELTTHFSRYIDSRKARQLFAKTLEIDPSYRIAFYHLIEEHIRAEDLEAAERLIAEHRRMQPDSEILPIAQMQLLSARGKFDEAIALGKELMAQGADVHLEVIAKMVKARRYREAHSLASESIAKDGSLALAIAYDLRAQAQIGLGHLREGHADLERAVEVITSDKRMMGVEKRHAAQGLAESAILLTATNHTTEAIEAARRSIEADACFPSSYFWLGKNLIDTGRSNEAEETLEQLRRMAEEASSPKNDFFIHLLAAELKLAAGEPARAMDELRQAAAMPREYKLTSLESWVRARVLSTMGDPVGALASYRVIFNAHVEYVGAAVQPTVRRMLALYNVARLEEETGDLDGARQHYREFLDHWGNADMPIPAVDEAKARLAALTGGGS
jgi:tetratricopeptide (TPR) repeat protein